MPKTYTLSIPFTYSHVEAGVITWPCRTEKGQRVAAAVVPTGQRIQAGIDDQQRVAAGQVEGQVGAGTVFHRS